MGGGSGETAYKGNYGSGYSPYQLTSMAPNVQQGDWSGMISNLNKGTLATGQKIPTYQSAPNYQFKTPGSSYNFSNPGYSQYQFNTPNVSKIPQQAYSNVLNRGLEGIQQDQQMFGNQTRDAMVGRGLGRSGFNNSAQSRLGREALQQASNLRSNIGMQQALGELDLGKFQAGQDLQRQGMQAGEGQFGAGLGQWLQNAQAGENLARSGMDLQRQGLQSQNNLSQASQSLQAMLGLSGLQQQQFGTYGTLLNQQNQQALQPYQMLAGLYSPALSQSFSSGGKGDPFTALMQGAGPIMTGAKAVCLPKGTQIEVEGGAMPVEELRLGDFVKGGEVIAIGSRKRHQGHSFYRHDFQNGSVIMSDGHPFFDELIKKEIVEHDSENTYDILTSEGHYFVNGVKLGSTLR